MIALAWRNLVRSRDQHLPVAACFALALALVMVAQGFLEGADRNLAATYPGALTGDLTIVSSQGPRWTLFGAEESLWGDSSLPPVLGDFDAVRAAVDADPRVEASAGLLVGPVLVDQDGTHHPAWCFGADFGAYGPVVPGLVTGTAWRDGAGVRLAPGLDAELGSPAEVRLLYSSGGDFQIVRGRVEGVAGPRDPVTAAERLVWLDAPSARHLFGLGDRGEDPGITLDESDLLIAPGGGLFGEGTDLVPVRPSEGSLPWHFLVVRLTDRADPDAVAADLNRAFQAAGLGARAVLWRQAAGGGALFVVWLQGLLALGVVLLALVGAGSLVNVMTGIVVERTAEVGTLRALGASRALVYRLFGLEALLVVLGAWAGAAAAAGLVALLLGTLDLHVANAVFGLLLGSQRVTLALSPATLAGDGVVVVALALGATAFPLRRLLSVPVVRTLEAAPE